MTGSARRWTPCCCCPVRAVRLHAAAVALAVGATMALPSMSSADVDVILHPLDEAVTVYGVLEVQVIIASDSKRTEFVAAAEIILAWDPEKLQLLGNHEDGAVDLLTSTFPTAHPSGLNESNPPQDGIGMFMAWAPLGNPAAVPPSGVLLTTLEFAAIEPTGETQIAIVPFVGDPDTPDAATIIFDGLVPNFNITGTLTGANVAITLACPGDLNDDGVVGIHDLLIVLDAWGPCADPAECPADLSMNGQVSINDLLVVLANWGACP